MSEKTIKERPILFRPEMVRAILEGRKSQTRRVVNTRGNVYIDQAGPPHCREIPGVNDWDVWPQWEDESGDWHLAPCPYGVPGDRLWIRETFFHVAPYKHAPLFAPVKPDYLYRADYDYRALQRRGEVIGCHRWTPSIHMPRAASRLSLEVASVRVERLNEISETDARAEGMEFHDGGEIGHSGWRWDRSHGVVYETCRMAFRRLFESINGPEAWEATPWVWVVEFNRVESAT